MIKLVVLDIDGVLTDGCVIVNMQGEEQKKVNLKDIDAVFELHKQGFRLAAITGEDTSIVTYFKTRFPWDSFYQGNKKKQKTLEQLAGKEQISLQEICYVGDGKYDVEPLQSAGLGICPADAIDKAKQAADIVLQYGGGQGCLWELLEILKNWNQKERPEHFFYNRLEEHADILKKIASDQLFMGTVMNLAGEVKNRMEQKGKLFLCGNGGSAADAQHIATEFVSRFFKERPGMNAEALTVNTSTLTAVGNDYGFERIFVRQLEAKAAEGDILIGISTSGKSKNVLEALRYAKKSGIRTAILMGDYVNLELENICDYIIRVPSRITPRIQEVHIFIGHTIAEYVEQQLFLG